MNTRYGWATRAPQGVTMDISPTWIVVREKRRFARSGALQFYVFEKVTWTRQRDGLTETRHERIAGPVPKEMADAIVSARENAARVPQLEQDNAAYTQLLGDQRDELRVIAEQLEDRAGKDPVLKAIAERINALRSHRGKVPQ